MNDFLLDCKGREILLGDLLKVFHFTGRRRKKNYMYKHVIERLTLGNQNPVPAYKLSHLELKKDGYYYELINGRQLMDYEIVQGFGGIDGQPFYLCLDERPKREPTLS